MISVKAEILACNVKRHNTDWQNANPAATDVKNSRNYVLVQNKYTAGKAVASIVNRRHYAPSWVAGLIYTVLGSGCTMVGDTSQGQQCKMLTQQGRYGCGTLGIAHIKLEVQSLHPLANFHLYCTNLDTTAPSSDHGDLDFGILNRILTLSNSRQGNPTSNLELFWINLQPHNTSKVTTRMGCIVLYLNGCSTSPQHTTHSSAQPTV